MIGQGQNLRIPGVWNRVNHFAVAVAKNLLNSLVIFGDVQSRLDSNSVIL